MILKSICSVVVIVICFGLMAYSFTCDRMPRMKKKELFKHLQRIQKALTVVSERVLNGDDEYDGITLEVLLDRSYNSLQKIFDIVDNQSNRKRFDDLIKND